MFGVFTTGEMTLCLSDRIVSAASMSLHSLEFTGDARGELLSTSGWSHKLVNETTWGNFLLLENVSFW